MRKLRVKDTADGSGIVAAALSGQISQPGESICLNVDHPEVAIQTDTGRGIGIRTIECIRRVIS